MKLDWPKLALRWKEALGKYKYVLLVIGLGVVLMALPRQARETKARRGPRLPLRALIWRPSRRRWSGLFPKWRGLERSGWY